MPDGVILYRCMMQWHYGTIAPTFHVDPDGETGWTGCHGAATENETGICDECAAEWANDYPRHDLPIIDYPPLHPMN